VFQVLDRPRSNGHRASRTNIQSHYDLGNDFYRLWLDEALVYTCAYYRNPGDSLGEAQRAKLEHVSRKLALEPGERVLEAGCGWGALAIHMAEKHGVHVRAYNISSEQIDYARDQARRRAVGARVEFIDGDYREASGKYDAFVSVGMLEHVGRDHYDELGNVIDRTLTRDGRGLLHFIGRVRPTPLNAWTERHVFPGAHLPSLREALGVLEPRDLAVLDVEDLRLHYARTLEQWLENFEKVRNVVEGRFDAAFVRKWRLYLSSSLAGFRAGSLQLFQVLFGRPARKDLPLTRAHLYGERELRPGEPVRWNAARS
jgi:cyclopropane-fatty-acyl-phospholipid synthase